MAKKEDNIPKNYISNINTYDKCDFCVDDDEEALFMTYYQGYYICKKCGLEKKWYDESFSSLRGYGHSYRYHLATQFSDALDTMVAFIENNFSKYDPDYNKQ